MRNGNLFNYYDYLLLFMAQAFAGGLERFPLFRLFLQNFAARWKDEGSPNLSAPNSSNEGVPRVPKESVVLCPILIV